MNEGLFIQTPEDIKKSYCDLLAHKTLVENHIPILTGQEMIIDSNRKIAQITFNPPIELSGDIKIDIRQVNITSDHSSFIWFNSSFITDKLTIFTETEIDRSKASSSSSSSLSSSAYSYSDSSISSVTTTVEPSEVSEGSVLTDIESTSSRSMSAISSSRSLLPLVEESTDREFFIRCEFADKWLDDSEEYQALQIEREMSRNRSDIPLENEDGKSAKYLIQKAGTQILTSTRNLISRVSSQASSLHRSGSGTSSPNLSRQSSYSDIELKHMSSPPEEAGEVRVSINDIQLRDRREIELRKKMKLNSVHESEEFRKSLNVVPQTQENYTKVDEESSDEIQLDSEVSA